MLVLKDLPVAGYERVVRATDETTGLDACISIHNIDLGPAIGGCRYYNYLDFDAQRIDALRLSKHMTYKNAIAGLHNGGAKTTIMARAANNGKSPDLWKSFAEALNKLNGIYYTAGDIGTTQEDLIELHKHTEFVLGYSGQDSGWATAYGVYNAICGAYSTYLNDNSATPYNNSPYDPILESRSVGVIGLGKVGSRLIKFLANNQPKLTIYTTDVDKDKYLQTKELVKSDDKSNQVRIQWCQDIEELNQLPIDVYVPCATGGMINSEFAKICRAKIICGGANNQLENRHVAQELMDNGILYVPDYLANSGGVLYVGSSYDISHDVTTDLSLEWSHPLIKPKLEHIGKKVYDVLKLSRETNKPTIEIAKQLVEDKLKNL